VDSITASLADALDRLDEFKSVSKARPADQQQEALRCLWEAVGIDEDTLCLVNERLAEECERSQAGGVAHVLFGVIAGLLAAEYERDRRDPVGLES
jgi:hypothetical protein